MVFVNNTVWCYNANTNCQSLSFSVRWSDKAQLGGDASTAAAHHAREILGVGKTALQGGCLDGA